ncbi:DNA mismatch repair protein MutL [Lachnospiraceae bacterium]|uniref:DNA mismatch repair endonuclease MutL n=1 Tax=Extibacter sp. GGCC_0201 TaxID=2731209 RepID=UPI001AA0FF02|nr:DNA mismatch repair endonuclease MutL [Extibacter sp. GGCC_0201]MBO1721642.1 DNA mismatch repair endonuclease MutL [Extibacter sp. GGCC_0201]BDF33956.1 DNA mismatch repair protein MutL [Lachnospiraceae bacterium]BDF37960.1 DNA mismatch repair protein MutL [Lachnospiraceae bacterium]
MNKIQVLDQVTIDKIAAGEVIERPASVVKELVENAIDAGATSVTVEIKEGGISYIRIADNGCGIAREEVPSAFLRHSTSKIRTVDDLVHIGSLGFRGEALSSIAAVSQVELVTKTKEDTYGTSYRIAGGKEEALDDAGAPDGTTFLIRQLFYNTPARRKFLKTPMTEASHVGELVTRMALSHPEISFQFINNGQSKIHTSGNGNLKDVIYHVYGREIAANLLAVDYERTGMKITGYLGKPLISRGNRNFENYFINGRYVKSNMIAKAIEDAYKDFTMQHKYPFVVLHMEIDGEHIDVNVHPTKMELRFNNQQDVYNSVYEAVDRGLHAEELIPHVEIPNPPAAEASKSPVAAEAPVYPKKNDTAQLRQESDQARQEAPVREEAPAGKNPEKKDVDYFMEEMKKRVRSYHDRQSSAEVQDKNAIFRPDVQADRICEAVEYAKTDVPQEKNDQTRNAYDKVPLKNEEAGTQIDMFEEKLLERERKAEYKLIGQAFDTYWIIEFHDSLYIIDQHAAHERVLYERTLKNMKTREFTSQYISPPIILNLTMQEAEVLNTYMGRFTKLGFEMEEFGQESYAVRAVPDNLFGIAKKELLMEMIDSLSDEISRNLSPDLIDEKVASMSCKAAVKGNMKLSAAEVDALIGELLLLENPYHCPHGRPTIIAMTRRELEKKFKRIV